MLSECLHVLDLVVKEFMSTVYIPINHRVMVSCSLVGAQVGLPYL